VEKIPDKVVKNKDKVVSHGHWIDGKSLVFHLLLLDFVGVLHLQFDSSPMAKGNSQTSVDCHILLKVNLMEGKMTLRHIGVPFLKDFLIYL
jgi:hypothetical protein